jgi:DNA-binding response OmpR family regulator
MPVERILVADEADIRELLAHVLIDEGYSVDAVSTVAEQITSAMTSTF